MPLLAVWCLIAIAGTAYGSELLGTSSPTISLKDEVSVQTPEVYLKDIADLQTAGSQINPDLLEVSLGPAPALGYVRTLDRSQISEYIKSSLSSPPDVTFAGAALVRIILRGRFVDATELMPVLKAYISQATRWPESQIEIKSIGNIKDVELPPYAVTFQIPAKSPLTNLKNALLPIEAMQHGKTCRYFWVSVSASIQADILQISRKIPIGSAVAAEDIVETRTEISDLRATYERNRAEVVGKIARRTLQPGEPLTRELLTEPFMVRNGETVNLRLQKNGIVLATLARAEENGRLGQVIRVRNLEFLHSLKAQVIGRGEVRIE